MSYDNWRANNQPSFAPTGPRREPDEPMTARGLPCHMCGRPIHRVYTLADVGAFCSPGCRQKATEPLEKQGAA